MPTQAEIDAARAALAEDPDVKTAAVDGQSVSKDAAAGDALLRRWERDNARKAGTRPTAARIKIHGV